MINLDFADVETVMNSSGKAMMGTGEAEGENRAMAATELALNNPLIDEYTLKGAKGLLVNITGGSDIKLFEVDAAVNKIRAEVDPEAELIFGAIKDENMNGKIRVSIVATALNGSASKPYLNLVESNNNGSPMNRTLSQGDSLLFSGSQLDKSISSSIDGATALKLDESLEIKNTEEQTATIDTFESLEENQIAEGIETINNRSEDIPSGVSIESASYMENNLNADVEDTFSNNNHPNNNLDEEYTPKLFSDDQNNEEVDKKDLKEENVSEELFEQEVNEEEDFEIPAFLRRQKF